MKRILNSSFWQLLSIYVLFILAISLNLFWKYTLQFQIFALIIGVLGSYLVSENKKFKINQKIYYTLLILAFLSIIILRIIPYINNPIPLGYDAGIYKYGIEYGLQNLDKWVVNGGMEPGFLYLMKPISLVFSTNFILSGILILICLLLGIGIYLTSKEFFDKKTALISVFIYAFSIIQLKAFSYMYYKNIIGMALMLFSLYFLKKSESNKRFLLPFIVFGGLIGSIHRPTFYIFGLSYLLFSFISPYKNKKYNIAELKANIHSGIAILIITSLFYLGKFSQAITVMFEPVLEGFLSPGESAGTFINFFTFQFSSLFYLPLAILGLFYLIKKKDTNILVIWAIINFIIVYFQFFFFNRMIIFLDLVLIILASYGASLILETKKKLSTILIIILLLSAGTLAYKESLNSKPLIDKQELSAIQNLSLTPNNSFVMSTSSYYSPWILGYSERKTIAPGLFDYDNHTETEWNTFWTTTNETEIKEFMKNYNKPLYVFIGKRQKDNLAQFPNCFNKTFELESNKIYQYLC